MSQGLKIGGDSEQPDHCGEHTRSGHIRLHFGVLISIVLVILEYCISPYVRKKLREDVKIICLGELKSQLKLLCYSYSVSTTQVKETSSKYCFDRCARDSFYEEVSLEGVQNGI
ncbi:uncharacterized protein LOC141689677 [Apium graveolens]|uniref:uncharacterized protein LOC141689677 n=1 Tax=Apium graveolens TaxID=4045 RepID=UPI003D7B7A26